jgi:hypothetical protein
MEAVGASNQSANFYQTARCNNPEDSHLQKISTLNQASIQTYISFVLLEKLRRKNKLVDLSSAELKSKAVLCGSEMAVLLTDKDVNNKSLKPECKTGCTH